MAEVKKEDNIMETNFKTCKVVGSLLVLALALADPPPRRGPRDSSSEVKLDVSTVSWSFSSDVCCLSFISPLSIYLRVSVCLEPTFLMQSTILASKQGQRMQEPS